MKKKTFAVEVELTEQQAKAICGQIPSKELTDSQKIAGVASAALEDLANGGMVLDPGVSKQLLDIVGDLSDPQELVRVASAGKGMDDGRFVGKWFVDPTYEPVLRDIAANQGLGVDQVIQSLMDWGVGQGWAYLMSPDTVTVFFTQADMKQIREAIGMGHVTGTDITAALMDAVTAKAGR